MSKRLFSREELVDLAISGQARMRRALDTGDVKQVRKTLSHVLGLYRQFVDLYHGWTASLFAHLNSQYGHEATKGMTHIEYTLARSAEAGMNLQAVQRFVLDPESAAVVRLMRYSGRRFFYLSARGASPSRAKR